MDLPEYDVTLATDASLSKKGGLERDRQKGTIRSGWGWELKGALNRTINSGQHRTASPPTIYTLEGYAGFMGLLGLTRTTLLLTRWQGTRTPLALIVSSSLLETRLHFSRLRFWRKRKPSSSTRDCDGTRAAKISSNSRA